MKKLFLGILMAFAVFTTACSKGDGLSDDKVYFFYSETCPHCHDAQAYISKTYPNLKMERVDVATPEGYNLFLTCAKKFNLGNMIGTPLFCMGDKHMMGWAPAFEKKFDAYVKPFLETNSD